MKLREPFIAWPGLAHIARSSLCFCNSTLCFFVVYGGCDWITAHRGFRVRVDFAFEQSIPFVPAMTLVYMSIYLMFSLVPLVLRQMELIRAAMITTVAMICVAGLGFLLFPAELAYAPTPDAGSWQVLFDVADFINLQFNLAPSLHVALSSLVALILAPHGNGFEKSFLWTWALAISASALLTHQHHVIDVLTGHMLAAGCFALIYRRLIRTPAPVQVTSLSHASSGSAR